MDINSGQAERSCDRHSEAFAARSHEGLRILSRIIAALVRYEMRGHRNDPTPRGAGARVMVETESPGVPTRQRVQREA